MTNIKNMKSIPVTCSILGGLMAGIVPFANAAGACFVDNCSSSDNPWTKKCCVNALTGCRIYKRQTCYPDPGFRYTLDSTHSGVCNKAVEDVGGINDPAGSFCIVPVIPN